MGSYLTLLAFCLLATSTLLYLEIYLAVAPAAAASRLERLRAWLDISPGTRWWSRWCLLLGFWLAGESIYLLVS